MRMPPEPIHLTHDASDPNPFDLEVQWKAFLSEMSIDPTKMGPNQWRDMRRAFFGAWGALLSLHQVDFPQLHPQTYLTALDEMEKQVAEFWEQEARNN